FRVAVAATIAWATLVFVFNSVAGTNYGYLNAKPRAATALDLLPAWPWYVLAQVVIISSVWALMTWLWAARRR
ncbi:MAG: hypothetical protein ACRCYQ_10605, partial [Nocardioides sp.]